LKPVVSKLTASLIKAGALSSESANCIFGSRNFLSGVKDGILMGDGQNHYAVGIAAHKIAWCDSDRTDRNRDSSGFHLHTILARSHPLSARKHWISELATQRDIAADPVDDGSGDPSTMGDFRQDIAPYRRVFPAAVVEDDNQSGRNVIDIVAHRTSRLRCRSIKQRESSPRQSELIGSSLDPGALPVNPESVECIAQRCAVERGSTFNISFLFHRFNISS
jgi:hypothetical protein